jgi:hypothetical protein
MTTAAYQDDQSRIPTALAFAGDEDITTAQWVRDHRASSNLSIAR